MKIVFAPDSFGSMGNQVEAVIGYIHEGKTAVLEMAQASGLCLVPLE